MSRDLGRDVPELEKLCARKLSMPNMTGRPGQRTMEMIEEVPRRTSLAPLAFPCFVLC